MNPAIFSALASAGLAYEGVIVSGALHIATKNGEAMFFHDSIDFSAYTGTDGGSTPFKFVLTDAAGRVASAYGGAVGGGESLSSELITGWTNGAAAAYDTLTVNANGRDLDAVIQTTADTIPRAYTNEFMELGRIYTVVVSYTLNSGEYPTGIFTKRLSSEGLSSTIVAPYADSTYFWTARVNPDNGRTDAGLYFYHASNYLTNASAGFSCKSYIDVPATGLHLMSAKNGTTRNMASVESGFNPNTIVGVKIYG